MTMYNYFFYIYFVCIYNVQCSISSSSQKTMVAVSHSVTDSSSAPQSSSSSSLSSVFQETAAITSSLSQRMSQPSMQHSLAANKSAGTSKKVNTVVVTTQIITEPSTTQKTPSSGKTYCEGKDDDYCGKNGVCTNTTSNEKKNVLCLCKGNYYGNRCQYKGDFLYKQLTYAFGGTTGFLLLVVCCLLCCRKSAKQKKSEGLAYSQELDEFTIANKRASTTVNLSNNRNGVEM